MMSFGLRWRLAQGASHVARQVAVGVIVTAIVSVVFPFGPRSQAVVAPAPKITLRAELDAQTAPEAQPLVQQASAVVEAVSEPHAIKPAVTHRPKPVVAALPPARPHEAAETQAVAPAPIAAVLTAPATDWLSSTRTAVDVSLSALDTTKRWALSGKDWVSATTAGAVASIGQAVRFGP